MTPDDLRLLSTLLDQGFDLPVAGREPWLATLQGDAARLAPTLRDLLARHAAKETADLIDRVPDLATPIAEPSTGDAVGPYRLLRELGHGGMGAVWQAERIDGSLKRKVALKLPHVHWAPGLAERFAREREILASLEHPNIARLYDAGVDQHGRPFMALEYVEGQPIDEFCKLRSVAVEGRLRLLLQVADAVAFAHSRLVVHRDLKPGNILVTADAQVRLLDFGIAKLMEGDRTQESALTQAGGRTMTLDYASPEQIRGEPIGTASDVYSLAVAAYELLAGTRPYKLRRGSAAELEEAIANADAPLASSLTDDAALRKQLKGDLDAILNKALKKAPAERYPTIDALAQDWRRHLEGKRVYARPDTIGYRLMRFGRRQRVPLAAAAVTLLAFGLGVGFGATALVILALLAGMAASLWQARKGLEQARIARTEARTAEAVQNFLQGIFQANSGDQADPIRARQRSALELLDEGAARIGRELDEAPETKRRVVKTLGDIYDDMALYGKVIDMRRMHAELTGRVEGEISAKHAAALAELAGSLDEGDRLTEAQSVLERAESILARLPATVPAARTRVDLAWALHYRKRDDASGLVFAERAVASLQASGDAGDRAMALFLLGKLRHFDGQLDAARDALVQAARAAAGSTRKRRLMQMQIDSALGFLEQQRGDVKEAEAAYRRAIAAALAGNGFGSIAHATELSQFGRFLAISRQYQEALGVIGQARRFAEAWPDDAERISFVSYLLNQEGLMNLAYGRPVQAIEIYQQMARLGGRVEDALPRWLWAYGARASALTDFGHFEQALAELEAADALAAEHGLQATEAGERLWAQRVMTLLAAGSADDAQVALARLSVPSASGHDAIATFALQARLELARGRTVLAIESAHRAIARLVAAGSGRNVQQLASMHLVIGQALLAEGRADEARRVLEASNALVEPVLDPEWSLLLADVAVALAQARLAGGERAAATALAERVAAIHARYPELGAQHAVPLERLRASLDQALAAQEGSA